MKTTTNTTGAAVMVEGFGANGEHYLDRGRRNAVLVSREHAWSTIQAWQKLPNVQKITVKRAGDTVWSWAR